MWEYCSNSNLNKMFDYNRKCNFIFTVMSQRPQFSSSCDVTFLSQTWTLGMVWEGGRSPVCWCISGQTLSGSSVFEDRIKNANHIGIRPFGGFNYIYLIFIPHCNSTHPFPGAVDSMKPDVVFNLPTSLWKTDSCHCGNVLKTNWNHSSYSPQEQASPRALFYTLLG